MALLSIQQGQLAYGHVALLDHVEFSLQTRERVGLIGRNGTGKSSLLKIIAGTSNLDDGQIVWQQGVRCAYVAQEAEFDQNACVFDVVAAGLGNIWPIWQEYEAISMQAEHSPAELARMDELQHHIEDHQAWDVRYRVETVLTRLRLDGEAIISGLSGGTQKRIALAQGLVAQPDILLLDEPTNHLDLDAIAWLENLLNEFTGSIIFITHDRQFLDTVATRIVELDRGKLYSFPGNFTTYQARKADLLSQEALLNARADKLLAQEEIWIRKGVEARRTRSVHRIAQLEKLRETRAARRDQVGQVRLKIDDGTKSGKIVADLDNVSLAFDNKPALVKQLTTTILRGDKVGLIGPNGVGKTTLLRLILGDLKPNSGTVKIGSQLSVAYFDQLRTQLDLDKNLLETISPGSDWVEIQGKRQHVMSYLESFLFAPERARSPVRSLSGGERNRLLLARLFARPANVLVLDEPTNDLDIDTLELLESLLQDYNGTVFLVSHDRSFLDNVVTCSIVAEGEGFWREYPGGYSDWMAQRTTQDIQTTYATPAPIKAKTVEKNAPPASAPTPSPTPIVSKRKLSYKEQRELENLPNQIEMLEAEQTALMAQMNDPEFYRQPAHTVKQVTERHAALDDELLHLLARWEELSN